MKGDGMAYIMIDQKGHVAQLTINRPEGLNALNRDVLQELSDLLDKLENDPTVRALIITGAGERAFVAGADIGEMAELTSKEAEAFSRFGNRVMQKIHSFPVPVIAAVNGFALGGGFELALACDLRIASERGRFAFPETGLGITPGFGGTQRLARLVGQMTAYDLILTGRRIKPDEALALGIIGEVTPIENLLPRAWAIAQLIADRAPVATRQAKLAIREGLDLTVEEGLALEEECFGRCFDTKDQKDAMSAFLNKEQAPLFKGE